MAWTWPAVTDRTLKPLVLLALAAPALVLGYDISGEIAVPGSRLGADPTTAVVRELGSWAIRFLLLTLAVSSARRLLNVPRVMRYRRMIGLTAFFYVVAHFTAYVALLAGLDWPTVRADLTDRPYISVGFLALVLLLPLAITSTAGWRRRLGRRWVVLHRIIYPVMGLALLHEFWLTKDDYSEPVLYLALFLLLMIERYRMVRIRAARTA